MAWRQMTIDSEAGPYQLWVDDATGQTTTTNPALSGANLGYTSEMRQGADGAMVDTSLVNSIGGVSADKFQTRVKADGRLETLNPTTVQWEKTYRAPFDMAGGNQFVPESIGKPIGGSYAEFNAPAKDSSSLFERALPMLIMGGLTGGIGSALGAGLGIGATASSALAGGLTSGITGGDPLRGALMSALGSSGQGLLSSSLSPSSGITDLSSTGGATPGANMNFFDELLGLGSETTSWTDEAFGGIDPGFTINDIPSFMREGSDYTIDMSGHAIDAAGNVVNGTDGSIMDFIQGAIQSGNLDQVQKLLGVAGAAKSLLGGSSNSSGSSGSSKSFGGSILDSIFGDGSSSGSLGSLGTTVFNSAPFLLALQQANSQSGDAQPYIDKLTALGDQFSGNQSAFIQSLTNPYDQSTATGRGQLQQSLGLRGVAGSSFGDQALGNYDYTRDMGRGDLVAKGTTAGIGAQGQLTTAALDAVNKRNLNKNTLLGAGLSASGRLFQPANDPFNIKSLLGA